MSGVNVDLFFNYGFKLIEKYEFNSYFSSYIFEYNNFIIIVDDDFDKSEHNFLYSTYCEMQNRYMYEYDKVLRFNNIGNDLETINEIIELTNKNVEEIEVFDNGGHRDKSHFDNTPAEKLFEDAYTLTYGNEALNYLQKEVQVSLGENNTASIDFFIETKSGNYSFEANGISYHDPLIVGKDRYKEQLNRQNILVLFGIKVYRFASNTLKFKEQISDSLKKFLKNKEDFLPYSHLKKNRKIELYNHQKNVLELLDKDRKKGKTTALIVLPTGTGKSQICIEDLKKDYIHENVKRVLIMTPSLRIKEDWLKRIDELSYLNYEIDVFCYNYVFATKNMKATNYYDYIIFDEAHHAQAANCKKTIQYFNPKYLIGLTATPERLDLKSLEEIFGHYEVNMTLKEAIVEGVVCDISCYRLKSNLDLSTIRYNGQDYNYSDLENNLIIDSRNILISDTLRKYFAPKTNYFKQGIIFCVNKNHCQKMAELLNQNNLKARAVYGSNSKNELYFNEYAEKKVQFLCSCQLISEGWDSPQTEIIVMARPTLSKILYLQQLGRGLRHYEGKKCLYLIDVVDNYSVKLMPWSFNSLFKIANYVPFGGILSNQYYLEIEGLVEKELKLEPVDIFTFEEKYHDYLSLEQAARYLYVGTETLNKWNKAKSYASLYLPIGNKSIPYFSLDDLEMIKKDKKLKEHNEDTILDDFIDFIDENSLTYSFKLIFLLLALKLANKEGEINLNDLVNEYRKFYLDRLEHSLPVDKKGCIYTKEYLNDFPKIKRNMLDNPFEKFERKRFFYLYETDNFEVKYNKRMKKDLNIISFNPLLWAKLNKDIIEEIKNKELVFLKEYYKNLGGLNEEYNQKLL